jgi:hypothetical protein
MNTLSKLHAAGLGRKRDDAVNKDRSGYNDISVSFRIHSMIGQDIVRIQSHEGVCPSLS